MAVEKAVAGIVVKLKAGPQQDHLQEFTVKPACDIKDHGRWICLTHDKVFWNGFEKDSHIERGKHVLAWFCAHHGVEAP